MIINAAEMTRLHKVPFPALHRPAWSFGAHRSDVARTLVRVRAHLED